MRSHVAKCVYEKGLQTPFVNLEDIFITGLAAEKCKDEGVVLRNSPRFHYMGRHLCLVKKYDILVSTYVLLSTIFCHICLFRMELKENGKLHLQSRH